MPSAAGMGGASGAGAAQGGKSGGAGAGGAVGSSGAAGSLLEGGDASGGGDPGSGGSTTSGGSATSGGSMASGGSAGDGAGGSAGVGGAPGLDSVCPSDTGATGELLSPPSTDFEQAGSWATLAGHSCSRTVASASTGNACSGSAFLTCDVRQAPWDGATIAVPNFVYGHTYAVTVALRYSPPSAPTTASPLAVTCIRTCAGGTAQYVNVGSTTSSTSGWVRISGEVTASLPGCSALSEFRFYANTLQEQQTYDSVDMDDFRMYDLTPGGGGSSGAGTDG